MTLTEAQREQIAAIKKLSDYKMTPKDIRDLGIYEDRLIDMALNEMNGSGTNDRRRANQTGMGAGRVTRAEKAKELLLTKGITSADQFPSECLGVDVARNRRIVQMVIFEGTTLQEAADKAFLSHERTRVISLLCANRFLLKDGKIRV